MPSEMSNLSCAWMLESEKFEYGNSDRLLATLKVTHHTTVSDLTPLYRSLESSNPSTSLPPTLLHPLATIIRHAQDRRYRDATDAYLQLSIGKAAWPIGVTMVGIHERSAREKLHESDKGAAHIMSDEVTRKFLQSIKRCLSFAQTRWPPTDQLQLMG